MQTNILPNCTVGFVYNEPCPLKCNFCCHTTENVGPGRLTPKIVTPVLIRYANDYRVVRFAFTGGDPFVYIRDIIAIMTEARSHSVSQPFHIVTSGFWAKDDDITEKWLSKLAALGMDLLYVSYDLEHQKWVLPEYIYRIEKFCAKYNIVLSVYGVFWEAGTKVTDLLPELKTKLTNETLVSPIGRARDGSHLMPRPTEESALYSCRRPFEYDITIYPNGDTYPCCSGGFNKEAELILGNSFTDAPQAIIEKCMGNFFVTIAKELGFDKLYERAKAEGVNVSNLPKFDEVTTVCQICSQIHRNPNMMAALHDTIQNMEVEYCLNRFRQIDEVTRVPTVNSTTAAIGS